MNNCDLKACIELGYKTFGDIKKDIGDINEANFEALAAKAEEHKKELEELEGKYGKKDIREAIWLVSDFL